MKIYLALRNPEVPDPRDVPGHDHDLLLFAVFHPNVEVECLACPRMHDKLWTVDRRPEPWGHFSVAQINKRDARGRFARKTVIDRSLPTTVDLLPPDAVELSPEEAARTWHYDNESHVFGGPHLARYLREAIAR